MILLMNYLISNLINNCHVPQSKFVHGKYYVIIIRAFLDWLNEEIQSRMSPKRFLFRQRDIYTGCPT